MCDTGSSILAINLLIFDFFFFKKKAPTKRPFTLSTRAPILPECDTIFTKLPLSQSLAI